MHPSPPDELFKMLADNYPSPVVIFSSAGILFRNAIAKTILDERLTAELFATLWSHKNEKNITVSVEQHAFFVKKINKIEFNGTEYYHCILSEAYIQEHFLARIVEESSVSMIIFDKDLIIRYVNEFAVTLYEYPKEELIGRPIFLLSGEDDGEAFFRRCLTDISANQVWRGEDIRMKKRGDVFISSSSITEVHDENDRFLCYYDASHDNSERVMIRKKWELSAKTDALTGIPNRRALFLMLEQQWDFAIAHNIPISIIFCDIDHFKEYNDTYGHPAGDEVLRAIAQRIRASLRVSDLVARYGGEEFVIVLVGADKARAATIVQKLRTAISELAIPHNSSSAGDVVSLSFGITEVYPADHSIDMLTAIKLADEALYEVKEHGRNGYAVKLPDDRQATVQKY